MSDTDEKQDQIAKKEKSNQPMIPRTSIQDSQTYREEISLTIDSLRDQLADRTIDKRTIENNLNLMRMKEEAKVIEDISRVEKQLWSIAVNIQDPTFNKQRIIISIVIFYTLLTFAGFLTLTFSDRVLLPGFNIPYSVLLMGLVGSLVSLFARLNRVRKSRSIERGLAAWFITNPPIAVIMSGIFFGLVQIMLPVFEIQLLDESWPFWILAWLVGLNNWVYLFEKFSALGDKDASERVPRTPRASFLKRETVRHEVVHETSEHAPTAK
jgi:hypothetical protein